MPPVRLAGSQIRRHPSAALVAEMPVISGRRSRLRPPLRPERGDVVRQVAGLGHLQEQPKRRQPSSLSWTPGSLLSSAGPER